MASTPEDALLEELAAQKGRVALKDDRSAKAAERVKSIEAELKRQGFDVPKAEKPEPVAKG